MPDEKPVEEAEPLRGECVKMGAVPLLESPVESGMELVPVDEAAPLAGKLEVELTKGASELVAALGLTGAVPLETTVEKEERLMVDEVDEAPPLAGKLEKEGVGMLEVERAADVLGVLDVRGKTGVKDCVGAVVGVLGGDGGGKNE